MYDKKYYENNRDAIKASRQRYRERNQELVRSRCRAYNKRMRDLVVATYGGEVCALCDERRPGALHIDHIGGGGKQHKKITGVTSICKWLVKMRFPTGYRVLCANCNFREHWADLQNSTNNRHKRRRQAVKAAVMAALGGRCANCGETDLRVLTVHHVNRDGALHRRTVGTSGFYDSLLKTGNLAGLSCLCFSCNDNAEYEVRRLQCEP